jgi:hypothetical protein
LQSAPIVKIALRVVEGASYREFRIDTPSTPGKNELKCSGVPKPNATSKRQIISPGLSRESIMIAELQLLEEWIPEQMEPGTLFVLENAGKLGEAANPYWAVLSCPACGALGLITRRQYKGSETMICGAHDCSAEYYLRDGGIEYRRVQ